MNNNIILIQYLFKIPNIDTSYKIECCKCMSKIFRYNDLYNIGIIKDATIDAYNQYITGDKSFTYIWIISTINGILGEYYY